jgi:hypothetical protein
VIDNLYAPEIDTFSHRDAANSRCITEQSDVRQAALSTSRGSYDSARIIAFRQYNVLEVGGGTFPDAFQYRHSDELWFKLQTLL